MINNIIRLFFVLFLSIQLCNGLKNCSYKDRDTQKIRFNTCSDNQICCENSYSMLDACCPDETHYVAPIRLSLRNIMLIFCMFFGIIFFGAGLITIMMSISACLTKKSLNKSADRRKALISFNSQYEGEYL